MTVNLSTEALARASGRRPWIVVAVWLVLIAGAVMISGAWLQDALTTEFKFTNQPESEQGFVLMEERFRDLRKANEVVVVRSEEFVVDDGRFVAVVNDVYGKVVGLGPDVVESGFNFYQTGDPSMVSDDGHSTIMPFVMAGSLAEATDNIGLLVKIVGEADESEGFRVLVVGDASVANETNEIAESDLAKGEAFAVPVAMLILVLVLGVLLAAILPVILAVVSILLALGLTALLGQAMEVSFFVVNMITMMGLAVGIDYSLFIVARYREERALGREKIDAIGIAGATASRAVFFSGLTVVLALIGMVIVPTTIFLSLGIGAILVVFSAVAASLTLLPAALSLMGDRVNALKVPFVGRISGVGSAGGDGGFWDRISTAVMKRPLIYLVITVSLLIVAAVPFFDMETGLNGVSTMPDGTDMKDGFMLLERDFSFGTVTPAYVVIDGEASREAIDRLVDSIDADATLGLVGVPETNAAGDVGLLTVSLMGDPGSEESVTAVHSLRDQYVPDAFGSEPVGVYVTGVSAFNVDFFEVTTQYMPIVFAVVLSFSFLLLLVVFRSIVVPLKAIVMNLLSVGAAYGLMVLVIQKGFGAELLGFQQARVIDAWIPLFLFSVLFGLSMDYHVFLLSRIRERYDQTGDNAGSVAYGLRSTAGIITGAALIMVAVFGGFALGDMVMMQQVGFGLAVAVLLDATIVRSVLVPASMKLLGDRNWYLPSVLSWLPDVRVEAERHGG